MNLEQIIADTVADTVKRQLTPFLESFRAKGSPDPSPPADDLLTRPEAAKLLRCSTTTLAIWKCKGKGPECVSLGSGPHGGVRYRRSALLAFIDANQRGRVQNSGKRTVAKPAAAAR